MICKRCGMRAETRDCSSLELHYGLCDLCIAALDNNNELYLWDDKYRFAFKPIDGDYWDLYENRDFIAKVHKDNIKELTNTLNKLYNTKHDLNMKLFNVEHQLESIIYMIKDNR